MRSITERRWTKVIVATAIALVVAFAIISIVVESNRRVVQMVERCGGKVGYRSFSIHPKVDWLIPSFLRDQVTSIKIVGYQDTASLLPRLRRFSELEELVLRSTDVTNNELQYVAAFPNLNTLILDGTKVTNAGLHHLSGLKQLRVLGTRDTAVTFEGLETLETQTKRKGPCHTRAWQELISEQIVSTHAWQMMVANRETVAFTIDAENVTDSQFDDHLELIRRLDCTEHIEYRDFGRQVYESQSEPFPPQCLSPPGNAAVSKQQILSEQICQAIGQMKRVNHISFVNTPISDESLKYLRGLNQLQSLTIDHSSEPITALGLEHLSVHQKLVHLRIDNLMSDSRGFEALRNCQAIMTLTLRGNITAKGLDHISQLNDLRHLSLRMMRALPPNEPEWRQFNDSLVKVIVQCPLRSLIAREVALSDSTCVAIGNSTSLNGATILCSNLTSANVAAIAKSRSLEYVNFDRSNLSLKHIDALLQFPLNTRISINRTPLAREDESVLAKLRLRFDVFPKPKR